MGWGPQPRLLQILPPDHATIASPTSLVSHRIVTTMGQMKRDMQFDPLPDDFRFRQHQQGGFDMEGFPSVPAFVPSFTAASNARMNSGRQSG